MYRLAGTPEDIWCLPRRTRLAPAGKAKETDLFSGCTTASSLQHQAVLQQNKAQHFNLVVHTIVACSELAFSNTWISCAMPIRAEGSNTPLLIGLFVAGTFVVFGLISAIVFCAAKASKISRNARRLVRIPSSSNNSTKKSSEDSLRGDLSYQGSRSSSSRPSHDSSASCPAPQPASFRAINSDRLTVFADYISPPQAASIH